MVYRVSIFISEAFKFWIWRLNLISFKSYFVLYWSWPFFKYVIRHHEVAFFRATRAPWPYWDWSSNTRWGLDDSINVTSCRHRSHFQIFTLNKCVMLALSFRFIIFRYNMRISLWKNSNIRHNLTWRLYWCLLAIKNWRVNIFLRIVSLTLRWWTAIIFLLVNQIVNITLLSPPWRKLSFFLPDTWEIALFWFFSGCLICKVAQSMFFCIILELCLRFQI